MDSQAYFTFLLIGSALLLGVRGDRQLCPTGVNLTGLQKSNSSALLQLNISQAFYTVGTNVTVTLVWNSNSSFDQVYLQAQTMGQGSLVGTFTPLDPRWRVTTCSNSTNALSFNNTNNMTSIAATWLTTAGLEQVNFSAIVIRNNTYWSVMQSLAQNIGSQNISSQNISSHNISSQNISSQNISSQNVSSQNISSLPNVIVSVPLATITNVKCNTTKTCLEFPMGCNPAAIENCLFASTSTASTNGKDALIEIKGQSSGYIMAGLSPNSTLKGDAFICAKLENGNLTFLKARYNGVNLAQEALGSVDTIKGSVNGSDIQCSFIVRNVSTAVTRSADTQFYIGVAIGNITNGMLGQPVVKVSSKTALDLVQTSSGRGLLPTAYVVLMLAALLTLRVL